MQINASVIKPLISVLLFISILVGFYTLIGQDKTELPSQLIDRPVPAFSVVDLTDKSIEYTEQMFIGKISLLNVWASWCPSCYDEHPYWQEYAKNKDLSIVGLNYRDKEKNALRFLSEQGNPYESNLFDHNGRLGIEFGVYGAPETFLIDPHGVVRYRHVGIVSPKVYDDIFLPLIAKIKKGF